MIGDLNRLVLAENLLGDRGLVGALVNLNSVPLKPTDFPTIYNDIRITNMNCKIKYSPKREFGEKHYSLSSDLIIGQKNVIRFENYAALKKLSETNKIVSFLIKWAEIDEEALGILREIPGGVINFPINVKKYARYLRETFPDEVGEFVFTTEMMNTIEQAKAESRLELRKEAHRERSRMDREQKRRNK